MEPGKKRLFHLRQLQLAVHHIQGVKNKCADYINRHNFDDLIGTKSKKLAEEAFTPMEGHLDLNMTVQNPWTDSSKWNT